MILEYKILWFENNKHYFELARPPIEAYLKSLNFNPTFEYRKDDSDLNQIMQDEDIDLILVDQNLRKGGKGDKIIDTIRKDELYTEVVFYSQYRDFQDKIIKNLQGVFFTDRENLEEKTKKIIDLTIKKNQDIRNIRGLFIAESIDMATQMEEIIIKILKVKDKSLEILRNQIIQEEFYNDYEKYKLILSILKEKLKVVNQIINGRYNKKQKEEATKIKSELEPLERTLAEMEEEVIKLRNKLAHSKPSPTNRKALICKKSAVEFNDTECRKIRRNFKKHSENLEKIDNLIDKIVSIELPNERT
jgi:hypothetical protein